MSQHSQKKEKQSPMNVSMLIAVIISVILIGWAISYTGAKQGSGIASAGAATSTIIDGKQFIDITAKGGYSPRVVVAKAGMPTTIRMTTNGTYDCSATVVIPKLSYRQFLQPSGTATIDIPADQATGTLQGLCGMGMYNFQIRFQ